MFLVPFSIRSLSGNTKTKHTLEGAPAEEGGFDVETSGALVKGLQNYLI
jgi:hypothetical protein